MGDGEEEQLFTYHYVKGGGAGRGSQQPALPVEGEKLQPPSCCPPQAGAPPSSSATTHTQWPNRALAALPPGNYTLGASLLPLAGEAWGDGEEKGKGDPLCSGSAESSSASPAQQISSSSQAGSCASSRAPERKPESPYSSQEAGQVHPTNVE